MREHSYSSSRSSLCLAGGKFALKPLEAVTENEKAGVELRVQMYWQVGLRKDRSPISLLEEPGDTLGQKSFKLGTTHHAWAERLDGDDKLPLVCTGDVLTLTTDDRLERRLPDRRLLELRWNLARMLAMKGQGKDTDLEFRPDENGLDLDYVGIKVTERWHDALTRRTPSPSEYDSEADFDDD